MAETNVTLNAGTGGAQVATYADASSRQHQEVVVQTQNGSSDPVSVSSSNPLPVVNSSALPAGSNTIGNVGLTGAIPAGANTIGGVTQGTTPWTVAGNVASGAGDTGNPVKAGGVYNSAAPTLATGQRCDLQVDTNGNLCVNLKAGGVPSDTDNTVFTAGSNQGLAVLAVYNDGIAAPTVGNAATPRLTAQRALLVAQAAAVNGGWTPYSLISAATTNATSLKTSAGQVGSIVCGNNGGSIAYLKLYNKASAPTVGTDVPVQVYPIPAGGGVVIEPSAGIVFSAGIAFSVNGGMANTDSTAVAAAQVSVSLGYL